MFNLFSKITNKDIEAIVARVLAQYGRDEDMQVAVRELAWFADEHALGSWKRSRFATQIAAHALQQGLKFRQAVAFGDAFGLFVHRRQDFSRLHWKAYAAGVNGALRYCDGWDIQSSESAGAILVDEYILNPADRAAILHAYRLGWLACGDPQTADKAARNLKNVCVSVASPGLDDPVELHAWRNDEITVYAENNYREKLRLEAALAVSR